MTTILIILGILLLLKLIDLSWVSLLLVICVILIIIFIPEILPFLFNLIVGRYNDSNNGVCFPLIKN